MSTRVIAAASPPDGLIARREYECRLTDDRWLNTLDEAREFLADRRLLSLTPSCFLPSLFGACAPNPDPQARGFGAWPPDKWWWGGALGELPEVRRTKLLQGKVLFLELDLFRTIAPLFQMELARTEDGAYGSDAQQLAAYLDQQGPGLVSDVRNALGLASRSLAKVRQQLESVGALLSEDVEVPARKGGGHIHTSRLLRFDQAPGLFLKTPGPNQAPGLFARTPGTDAKQAHRQLISAAVRAAVLAQREDVERWFAWPADEPIAELMREGSLCEPAPGWLATSL